MQLRARGVWGAPGAKHVTSKERDYLCYCPSWEQQVCLLMRGLPPLIFARMSAESLFRSYFVQLLLVSEELKRVYFKKVKAVIPGKWFCFLLGKSNCWCRPFWCRGSRLAATRCLSENRGSRAANACKSQCRRLLVCRLVEFNGSSSRYQK